MMEGLAHYLIHVTEVVSFSAYIFITVSLTNALAVWAETVSNEREPQYTTKGFDKFFFPLLVCGAVIALLPPEEAIRAWLL